MLARVGRDRSTYLLEEEIGLLLINTGFVWKLRVWKSKLERCLVHRVSSFLKKEQIIGK